MSHCLRVVAAISRLRSEGNVTETGAPDSVVGGIGLLVCETVPIVPCVTAFPVLLTVAVIPRSQTSRICRIRELSHQGGNRPHRAETCQLAETADLGTKRRRAAFLPPISASSFAEIHCRRRFPLSLNSHVAKIPADASGTRRHPPIGIPNAQRI